MVHIGDFGATFCRDRLQAATTGIQLRLRLCGMALIAVVMVVASAYGQSPSEVLMPPLPHQTRLKLQNNPEALREFMSRLPSVLSEPRPMLRTDPTSPWQPLTNPLNFKPGNPLLLTDGTVIVHKHVPVVKSGNMAIIAATPDWWRLTPDVNGNYVNGTWSQIASMPSGYAPLFFASAVLNDGRVIVEGGEFNYDNMGNVVENDTTRGAIYDPLGNSWKSVPPPSGWTTIGDAASAVLPDGTFMLANARTQQQALLNKINLNRASKNCGDDPLYGNCSIWTSTGRAKVDSNSEEGWTLLWDGSLLTVDTQNCNKNSERYLPWLGAWISAGATVQQLADCDSKEIGPQVLRPDGTVIVFPVSSENVPIGLFHSQAANQPLLASDQISQAVDQTVQVTVSRGSGPWAVGKKIPAIDGQNYTLKDAPAALLPSGNVLFAASPLGASDKFISPTHFFEIEYGTNNITQVADPDEFWAMHTSSYTWNFLVLPTGQILVCDLQGGNIWVYTSSSNPRIPNQAWAPFIAATDEIIGSGLNYKVYGRQFNGLSQGAAYGDDQQAATNYPLVQIVNWKTGHVFYARTFDHSTMGIGPNKKADTNFTVPTASRIETGLCSIGQAGR
jgi:hypothetical protein